MIKGALYLHSNKQDLGDDEGIKKAVDAILKGQDTQGLKIEKLHQFDNLYSFRLGKKSRGIFCYVALKQGVYLLVVKKLPNHEYQVLKQNKQNISKMEQHVLAGLCTIEALEPPSPAEVIDYNLKALYQFGDQTLLLNPHQQLVLDENNHLPMLIHGAPGSGKTSTVMVKLAEIVLSKTDDEKKTFIYVTKSTNLANAVSEHWQTSAYCELAKDKQISILFKTYDQIAVREDALTNEAEVTDWYRKQAKRIGKSKSLSSENPVDWAKVQSLVLAEFRFLCIYKEEEYVHDIGRKCSQFTHAADRQIVYDLYQSYIRQFSDIDYLPLNFKASCDLLFADETQDLTLKQIENLLTISKGRAFLCADTNQSTIDRLSIIPHLKRLFNALGYQKISEITLNESFRTPKAVTAIVNRLLKIKFHLADGKTDKIQCAEVVSNPDIKEEGFVHYSQNTQDSIAVCQTYKDIDLAVVCHDTQLNKAKKAFPQFMVFSFEQIKGLEKKLVIAFEPFTPHIFRVPNQLLDIDVLNTKTNRSKQAVPLEAITDFHAVFSGFTRASLGLVVQQPETHHTKNLLKHLALSQQTVQQEEKTEGPAPVKKETTEKEWEEEMQRLLSIGKEQNAFDIWHRILKRPARGFKTLQDARNSKSTIAEASTSNHTLVQEKPVVRKKRKQKNKKKINGETKVQMQLIADQAERELNNLFLNFDKQQLNHLLYATPELVRHRVLFHTKISENHRNLYSYILENREKTRTLLSCLLDKYLVEKKSPKYYLNPFLNTEESVILDEYFKAMYKMSIESTHATAFTAPSLNTTQVTLQEFKLLQKIIYAKQLTDNVQLDFILGIQLFVTMLIQKDPQYATLIRDLAGTFDLNMCLDNEVSMLESLVLLDYPPIYLEKLLEAGASLETDKTMKTAFSAVLSNSQRNARCLIKHYPESLFKNSPQVCFPILAKIYELKFSNFTPLFIKKGFDINYQDKKTGATLLMHQVGVWNFLSVSDLLVNGADPNLRTNDGRNALHHVFSFNSDQCCEKTLLRITQLLIFRRVNITDVDKQGNSPLEYAIASQYSLIVKALVEKISDKKILDKALGSANKTGNKKIIEILQEANSKVYNAMISNCFFKKSEDARENEEQTFAFEAPK